MSISEIARWGKPGKASQRRGQSVQRLRGLQRRRGFKETLQSARDLSKGS